MWILVLNWVEVFGLQTEVLYLFLDVQGELWKPLTCSKVSSRSQLLLLFLKLFITQENWNLEEEERKARRLWLLVSAMKRGMLSIYRQNSEMDGRFHKDKVIEF